MARESLRDIHNQMLRRLRELPVPVNVTVYDSVDDRTGWVEDQAGYLLAVADAVKLVYQKIGIDLHDYHGKEIYDWDYIQAEIDDATHEMKK